MSSEKIKYTVTMYAVNVEAESPEGAASIAIALVPQETVGYQLPGPHIENEVVVTWYDPHNGGEVSVTVHYQLPTATIDIKEATLPAAPPVPKRWLAGDVSCLIDESWGIHTNCRLVDIAMDNGWVPADDEDARICRSTSNSEGVAPSDVDAMVEIADEIVEWMNDHLVPGGYHIGWHESGLYYWPEYVWCELSGRPCDDLSHSHVMT
jgi:hypothetical protein